MTSFDPPVPPARVSRRSFLVSSTFAAGVGAALAACGGTVETGTASSATSAGPSPTGPAQVPTPTGKVVLYNYAEYVNPKTYKAFAAKYPQAEVVKVFYASEEEVSAKLRAGGTSQYDNVVVAGTTAAQLHSAGLLQNIHHEWLPNLKNVDPALIDGSRYDKGAVFSVPKNYGITGIAYDSSVVKDPPDSWKAFYDQLETYAPRTLLLEGATATIGSALQALGYNLGDGDSGHIKQALELLKSKKRYIGTISTAKFYTQLGKGGPVVLSQAWNGDVLRLKPDRPTLEFKVPQGPADAWVGVWTVPAKAPNPKASHAWINALLDPANAAQEMSWSLFPVSVPDAYPSLDKKRFDVPWITASSSELQRLASPVLGPDVLRSYNDAYTQFQAA